MEAKWKFSGQNAQITENQSGGSAPATADPIDSDSRKSVQCMNLL